MTTNKTVRSGNKVHTRGIIRALRPIKNKARTAILGYQYSMGPVCFYIDVEKMPQSKWERDLPVESRKAWIVSFPKRARKDFALEFYAVADDGISRGARLARFNKIDKKKVDQLEAAGLVVVTS